MRAPAVSITSVRRRLEGRAVLVERVAAAIGVLGLVASGLLTRGTPESLERSLSAYLTSFAFFLSLSLGALFFVLLHHLVRAGWSVVVRRVAEVLAANMPVMAVLALPIIFGLRWLYPWAAQRATSLEPFRKMFDPIIEARLPYLNTPFFLARLIFCLAVWSAISLWYLRLSTEQDRTGDLSLTRRMEARSAPFMVLFGVTLCVAAVDLLMSLDVRWYSTIFGVYYFAGSAVAFFAALAAIMALLLRAGYLRRAVTAEHFHDMGKLVFAFTIFWAYIAYSQYMLIWYANLPEETGWLLRRQTGGWQNVGLLLLFGHFVAPFLVLLPRIVKRSPKLLLFPALWVLAMHWADLYWIVMPQAGMPGRTPFWGRYMAEAAVQAPPAPHLVDFACFIGIGGFYVAAAAYRMRRASLVPERDPRLEESLAFESV